MVRIIAGTLIEVGCGKRKPEEMKVILNARDRNMAGNKAPAEGLTLISIEHVEHLPMTEHLVNEWTDYTIDRSQLETEGLVKASFSRCKEWERMLERTRVHAFRDGGKTLEVSGLPVDICESEAEKNLGKVIDKQRGVVIYYKSCAN